MYIKTSSNRTGSVIISVLSTSGVDRRFKQGASQANDAKFVIYCFFANHAAIGSKIKDWFTRNQDNVSMWSYISTRGLLLHWSGTIQIQLS
jgi:hypothetical protein